MYCDILGVIKKYQNYILMEIAIIKVEIASDYAVRITSENFGSITNYNSWKSFIAWSTVDLATADKSSQRIRVKFCVKLGGNQRPKFFETIRKVFEDDVTNRSTTSEYHKRRLIGHETTSGNSRFWPTFYV